MAFYISIGTTTDNNKKVGKTVSYKDPVEIHPTSIINQLNPTFIIDRNDSYLSCNYVKCDFLGRKYFATVSVLPANKMQIECSCDYLNSFDLSNCPIHVTRNGGINKPTKYPDSKFPIYPNEKEITSIVRTNNILNVNSGAYVLTVIGGGT